MPASTLELTDGANLAVHADGNGPDGGHDLLLVTGLGGTAAFWEPVLPRLTRRFRVIRFDQRGIAASTRGKLPVDIDRLADDSLAVLDHVGSKRALLLGHSTGGVILQSMALKSPARIAGLILSGTWLKPNRYMTELFRSRTEILKVAPREYTAMVAFLGHPPDWLNADWTRYEKLLAAAPTTPERQKVVAERIEAILTFDRSAEVRRIKLPALIQGAADDLIVPAFLQRELADALPHAKRHELTAGGHMFPVTRTDAFLDAVLGFADTIGC